MPHMSSTPRSFKAKTPALNLPYPEVSEEGRESATLQPAPGNSARGDSQGGLCLTVKGAVDL